MFKLSFKFARGAHGGLMLAQRGLRAYTRYTYYSLTDRKERQGSGVETYTPRYSLSYHTPEDFVLSQWSDNPRPYAVYRTVVAIYFLFMVFYTSLAGTIGIKRNIMLTYWSFYILTACQILRAMNVWHYISLKQDGKDVKAILTNSTRLKVQWVLCNLTDGAAPIVTFLFWTVAYDGSGRSFSNINTHGINAVFVVVDLLITRMPVRLLHMYQSSLYGIVYGIFTVLYWLAGGTNHKDEPYVYKCLDFSNKPAVALSYLAAVPLLVAPIIHAMLFFIYRFRLFIHRFLKALDKREAKQNMQKASNEIQ